MLNNFTLCPGGAFIQCESVAEFDPNMPNPITPEVTQQVTVELKNDTAYRPVDKVLHKLQPIADQVISLYSTEFTSDRESVVGQLDNVGELANEIANTMIMMLTKMSAMYKVCSCDEFKYSDVKNNLGYFIKNIQKINQQGYTELCNTTVSQIPMFMCYDMERMIKLYLTAYGNDLPDYPYDMEQLHKSIGYTNNGVIVFQNVLDMLNCMFHDPDRRFRLEVPESIRLQMDDAMSNCSNIYDKPAACDRSLDCKIIKFISVRLRMIKRTIYNLQSDVLDDVNNTNIEKDVRRVISGTIDLFAVPFMILIHYAYDVQNCLDVQTDINNSVKNIMNEIK